LFSLPLQSGTAAESPATPSPAPEPDGA